MIHTVIVGDADVIGDCCVQYGQCEVWPVMNMLAGGLTRVDVPRGFKWRVEPTGMLVIFPGWWRVLIYKITGRWMVPFLEHYL